MSEGDDAWAVTDVDPYEPGTRVLDLESEDDDPDPAVVLDYRRDSENDLVPAWAAPIQALDGNTVAYENDDYPRSDPVATVAFVSWLDANIGERWRTWDEDGDTNLLTAIDTFTEAWGIPMQTYDYPHSRLERVSSTTEGTEDDNTH